MAFSRYSSDLFPSRSPEKGYISWYNECTCCPYGYHIDLDFVRYCESITEEVKNRTGSIKRRKDRRKQRQSIDMLLGLTPPTSTVFDDTNKTSFSQKSPKLDKKLNLQPSNDDVDSQNIRFNDGLDNAISDFERALLRSKNKLSNNLPDVTAVSALSNKDEFLRRGIDTASIESCNFSPMTLQNIREALALSLERTKQLEQQVKLIPNLQNELAHLQTENERLNRKLKSEGIIHIANSSNYIQGSHQSNRKRSQSFTHIDNFDIKKDSSPPPQRDIGVMCGVLTRNIGVGHHYPNMKHASTATIEFADKWLPEKARFLNAQALDAPKVAVFSKGSQTLFIKNKRDVGIQSSILEQKKVYMLGYTQTDPILKPAVSHVGSLATSQTTEVGVQKNAEEAPCEKCNIFKKSLDEANQTASISLAALGNRNQSVNLENEKVDIKNRTTRTIASQCENTLSLVNKSSQAEVQSNSKHTQHEIKLAEKNTQYDLMSVSKSTNTEYLKSYTKSVACEAKEDRKETVERGINTSSSQKEIDQENICPKCSNKEVGKSREAQIDITGSTTSSRIPVPTTPTESRRFKRQDTYTKVYSPRLDDKSFSEFDKLSGLDLSPKAISNESIIQFHNVKQNLKLDAPASVSSAKSHNIVPTTKDLPQDTVLRVSESTIFQLPAHNRTKAIPSKEMQGAMKVLNDYLHKSSTKTTKNQNAMNIVQQEWFKISSVVNANPLDVEDYLDAFEDMSSLLLKYIVNMVDGSGNTAMHYAVSHGNFDVVSILLDSKVCDINKPNKAGYTSVMLLSLAEVKSQTHANVVRRLFHLADVNIRASQHGQTALMLAVSHGRLDMVKMLLEAGADVNIQDEDGSTALMCAAEHGHVEIVKHFLNQPECDSSITDVDGSTALKIAMEAGHRHIGVLLYAHERNIQKSQHNKNTKLKKAKSNSPCNT